MVKKSGLSLLDVSVNSESKPIEKHRSDLKPV